MMKIGLVAFTGVAMAAVLSGCASTEAELHGRETRGIAGSLMSVAERPGPPADVSRVQVRPSVYVGASVTRNDKGDPLPPRWQREDVSIARAAPATFQDIANAITRSTGIPVAVSADGGPETQTRTGTNIGVPGMSGQTPPGAPGGGMAQGPIPPGFDMQAAVQAIQVQAPQPMPASFSSIAGDGADLGVAGRMRLNYSGRLEGLLDLVAANFNIGWEYRSGRIVFSRVVTRTFDVPALPVISQLEFNMESGSSSGAGGADGATGSSNQTARTSSQFNLWDDLNTTLEGLVAGTGIYKLSPQTGQVIVVAPPATVDRVADYLKEVNSRLSQQVAIAVQVYSVTISDGDDYSSNPSLLFREAGKYGLSLVSPVNIPSTQGLGWAVLNNDSRFAESSGIVRALSERGDVSIVTSASVTALSGTPVPVQVAQTRGYARQVSVTQSESGNTTQIEPGSVTTGFNLHLVPRVNRDGSLLLQYGMNISELVGSQGGFDVFSSGESSIQLPNIQQRNFIQQANIPNGSTLVLAGFEQVRSATNKSGNLHSGLWPFGGQRISGMEREIIVIAITPTLLDLSPNAIAGGN